LALAIAAALLFGVFGQMRLYYDYGWQLMSVRDHARNDTTSPFVMRSADPGDLARDRTEWTIGYPLAYNAAGALLTATGLDSDSAHRFIVATAVLLGIAGWHLVLARCLALSPLGRAGALLLVSFSFNGLGMLGFMMPETFLFATVPWQMWALGQVMTPATATPRLRPALVLGVVTGVAYTFRYVAALHGLPLLACAAGWLAWRRPAGWWQSVLVMALAAALPVAALSAMNYAHVGAINSASSALPWVVEPHWPDFSQWLLVLTGPVQALFGSAIAYDRAAQWLGFVDFDSLKLCSRWLAVGPTILASLLLLRFAPRDRRLFTGLAGVAGTGLGLLWLYSRSGLPQPDSRYSVASALLLWPSLAIATGAAWRQAARWRAGLAVQALPGAIALLLAVHAHELALRPAVHGRPGGIIGGGRIDPPALRAGVAAHLPPEAGDIVWMCFQPSVLYALDGRHVFESYAGRPVTYRSSRPVTLVVLREKSPGMHPTVYENNHRTLDLAGRAPDFEHGDYEIFIRPIGPAGPIRLASAQQ
jgi:hypothetical protein